MNQNRTQLERQRRIGYLFLGSAVVPVLVVAAMVLFYGSPLITLGGAVPVVFVLVFFGYRNLSATSEGEVLVDEQERRLYDRAGNNTFKLLLGVMIADQALQVIPEEGAGLTYAFVGAVTYLLYVGYYRYVV